MSQDYNIGDKFFVGALTATGVNKTLKQGGVNPPDSQLGNYKTSENDNQDVDIQEQEDKKSPGGFWKTAGRIALGILLCGSRNYLLQ